MLNRLPIAARLHLTTLVAVLGSMFFVVGDVDK